MKNDAQIVERIVNGNHGLFQELVRRYQRPLFVMIAHVIHDRGQAADIVQETFLAAYKGLASFDAAKGSFAAWLFRIARNLGIDHCRKHREYVVLDDERAVAPQDTEATVQRNELFQVLDQALATLPERDRTIFVLGEIQGFALTEIAAIEGLRLGTVKSRLSRSRDKLRHILKTRLETP